MSMKAQRTFKFFSFLIILLAFITLNTTTSPAIAEDKIAVSQTKESTIKKIYLTFDDGPTDSTTPKILDILLEKKIHATFFVVGRQIKKREKILKRESDEGHSIGIHTYTHEYNKIYKNETALLNDINLCKKEIQRVLPSYSSNLYRFPGGSFGKEKYFAFIKKSGYIFYDWNASTEDAIGNFSARELFENAITSAKGKDNVILLMHDGVGYKNTIRALPEIIKYFQNKNYLFCTL